MKNYTVGRSPGNDYVLNDMSVSSRHARITVSENGQATITDLGSTNGTFVNGSRINGTVVIDASSRISLGHVPFDASKVLQGGSQRLSQKLTALVENRNKGTERLEGSNRPPAFSETSMGRQKVIGRGESCNIRLNASDVSTRHAVLTMDDAGRVTVSDLDSTNGTFVNGRRVSSKRLKPGDKLLISNKYYVDWEQVFPHSFGKMYGSGSHSFFKVTGIVLSILLCMAVLGFGGWHGYKYLYKGKKLTPTEIYAKYKKSVVMIYNSYTFEVGFKIDDDEYPLSTVLEIITEEDVDDQIDNVYLDADGDVQFGAVSGFGTGFFISDNGLVMTNRHVVSMLDSERKKEEEKVRKKMRQEISELADQLYYSWQTEYGQLMELADGLYVRYTPVSMGVFLNDTYVNSFSDMIPCTIYDVCNNEDLDVAIIQTNSKSTPATVNQLVNLDDISEAEDMELGCRIFTIGFPMSVVIGDTPIGLEANNQSGEVTQDRGKYTYGHNITIERGASGSPVFDCRGRFAGIIVSGYLGISQGYNHSVKPQPASDFYKKNYLY